MDDSTNSNAPNRPHVQKLLALKQVAFWRSYTLHQNQRFPPSSSWGIPARNVQPQRQCSLDTDSSKLSRKVTEATHPILWQTPYSLQLFSCGLSSFQGRSAKLKNYSIVNPWCFWYFSLLWNPSNSQETTVWSALSWRIHSRNTGLVSFCWHNCKLNAARQLQRNWLQLSYE